MPELRFAIKAQDLHFAYPGREEALRGVSFELTQGHTLGLLGANGSGKSTLLCLLAGLFSPDSGTLTVAGHTAPGDEKKIRSACGLVMQDADLQIIGSTVLEDLCLAHPGAGLELPEEVRRTAEDFRLIELLDRAVHELSWGQKKRLCLAATLHDGPEVLLLDEPFAGLDYPGIKQMRATVAQNRAKGLTQVISAHDLEPVADQVDHWLVLHRGELVLQGAGEEIFDHLLQYDVRPPLAWQLGQEILPWG